MLATLSRTPESRRSPAEMHLEFLLEEPSMEAALLEIVPRLRPNADFELRVFRGKDDLLRKLEARLRGYRHWGMEGLHIVVVVDRDNDDCRVLKQRLVDVRTAAGVPALCRIVIEELEAWFFGDVSALRLAFPKVSASIASRAAYRDPDAIRGGTWEALERVLQKAGYYSGGMPKVEVASRVSEHMDPAMNRSQSFQAFRDGVLRL